jgi:hypothetical protein
MEPSTCNWHEFMYAPAALLEPNPTDKEIVRTFQGVPAYTLNADGIWTGCLSDALETTVLNPRMPVRKIQYGGLFD